MSSEKTKPPVKSKNPAAKSALAKIVGKKRPAATTAFQQELALSVLKRWEKASLSELDTQSARPISSASTVTLPLNDISQRTSGSTWSNTTPNTSVGGTPEKREEDINANPGSEVGWAKDSAAFAEDVPTMPAGDCEASDADLRSAADNAGKLPALPGEKSTDDDSENSEPSDPLNEAFDLSNLSIASDALDAAAEAYDTTRSAAPDGRSRTGSTDSEKPAAVAAGAANTRSESPPLTTERGRDKRVSIESTESARSSVASATTDAEEETVTSTSYAYDRNRVYLTLTQKYPDVKNLPAISKIVNMHSLVSITAICDEEKNRLLQKSLHEAAEQNDCLEVATYLAKGIPVDCHLTSDSLRHTLLEKELLKKTPDPCMVEILLAHNAHVSVPKNISSKKGRASPCTDWLNKTDGNLITPALKKQKKYQEYQEWMKTLFNPSNIKALKGHIANFEIFLAVIFHFYDQDFSKHEESLKETAKRYTRVLSRFLTDPTDLSNLQTLSNPRFEFSLAEHVLKHLNTLFGIIQTNVLGSITPYWEACEATDDVRKRTYAKMLAEASALQRREWEENKSGNVQAILKDLIGHQAFFLLKNIHASYHGVRYTAFPSFIETVHRINALLAAGVLTPSKREALLRDVLEPLAKEQEARDARRAAGSEKSPDLTTQEGLIYDLSIRMGNSFLMERDEVQKTTGEELDVETYIPERPHPILQEIRTQVIAYCHREIPRRLAAKEKQAAAAEAEAREAETRDSTLPPAPAAEDGSAERTITALKQQADIRGRARSQSTVVRPTREDSATAGTTSAFLSAFSRGFSGIFRSKAPQVEAPTRAATEPPRVLHHAESCIAVLSTTTHKSNTGSPPRRPAGRDSFLSDSSAAAPSPDDKKINRRSAPASPSPAPLERTNTDSLPTGRPRTGSFTG